MAFGIVMGAVTPVTGKKRAAAVSGLVSAGAGLGSIVLSPAMQLLTQNIGLRGMLFTICVPAAVLIPVSIWPGTREGSAGVRVEESRESFGMVLKSALKDGSRKLGMLFGITFLFHQAGAFFSSRPGGVCVSAAGSYVLIWCVAMGFSLCAAILSFSVEEPQTEAEV